MAISDEQVAFVTDLFSPLGPITTRKMFGGLGMYTNGQIFALMFSDGSIRLKAVGEMVPAVEAAGWEPWVYTRKDGAVAAMPYWIIPDELLDDPDGLCAWARKSLDALQPL